jgi:UDP-N-acetylmuramyl pentapeptide phosphotransferase/UDP-N-acetylglucosamine-1-phosphate transferase
VPLEAQLIVAFALALAGSFAVTPLAIAVAHRTGFRDEPGTGVSYKLHPHATPYLGGVAVVAGFLLGSVILTDDLARLWPLFAATLALMALGTIDDRVNLSANLRLILEFALASGLWALGFGWGIFDSAPLNLVATNIWVVGLANSFNLIDNMDGVATTLAGIVALATGVLAALGGDQSLAVLCICLSGACFGFLPYNARRARIFLGDGGSLPIGFMIAVAIMLLPTEPGLGWTHLLLAPVLAGLPLADTVLRMVWRRRAGVPFLQGGRDSLTHILHRRLGSTGQVAVSLGIVQAALAAVAIGVTEMGRGSIVFAWGLWFATTATCVFLLERQAWAMAPADLQPAAGALAGQQLGQPLPRKSRVLPIEILTIGCIAGVCGLSPALYGFYQLSVWGPITLVLLSVLLGLVIARPAAPSRTALTALAGLAALCVWALLSTRWAESADQALTDANRWMLYAALLATLVLLLRNDRLSTVLIGSATAAVVAFGLYLCGRLLMPGAESLFLEKRLHDPLGYINGQSGYLLLGLWPLVAAAERLKHPSMAGAALSGAVVLAGLLILGQSRAVVPALLISAIVLVVALPGRHVRLWALVTLAAGVAIATAPLLEVYGSGPSGDQPDPATLRTAVLVLIGAAAFSGIGWWLARSAVKAGRLALTPPVRRASGIALLILALSGSVAAVVAIGDPVRSTKSELRAFKNLDVEADDGSRARFTTGGSRRYDYWSVAWRQFSDAKLKGVGAGNYDSGYFRQRKTHEYIRQPHSIELQTLAELGLVGGLALLVFVGAVLAGFGRRARAAARNSRDLGLAVAAGGTFLVWLVHTSVDWLHLIPGATGIALCATAVLIAPWGRRKSAPRRTLRLVTVAGCAAVALLGAVLVGSATLADKYRSDAQTLVHTNPRASLEKAAQSLELNDESLFAYYARAAAHARLNDYPGATAALEEATRREPHDFVPWSLLGDLAVRRGDYERARRVYRRASRLNPQDEGLRGLATNPASASP